MVMHGFDPSNGTIKEFTEFCERLERTVEEVEDKIPKKKEFSGNFKDRQGVKAGKYKAKGTHKSKYYCLIHGPNQSHDSNNCKHLIREAEKQKKNAGNKFPKKFDHLSKEGHTLLEFATKAMNDAKAE